MWQERSPTPSTGFNLWKTVLCSAGSCRYQLEESTIMLVHRKRNDLARRLAEIAAEAGVALDRLQKKGCGSVLKADGSPVSDADLVAETMISARLAQDFPDYPVISEENTASHETYGSTSFFLVDPLDGTKAYLAGAPDYCVLIALITDHVPVAAAIHAPATGQSWWAGESAFTADAGDFRKIRAIVPLPPREGGQIAIVSSQHAGEASRSLCRTLDVSDIKCENSALKFARLAEGEADIYPRIGRTMQWDIAAGDALLRTIGGGVFDLEGRPLRYGATAQGWANPDFIAIRVQPGLVGAG